MEEEEDVGTPGPSDAAAKQTMQELLATAQRLVDKINDNAGVASAAAAAATESQTSVASAAAEAQQKLADISTAATKALASQTEITDNQTVIATKSAHIQDAQEHADKVRGELDRALTAAKLQVTESEAAKARVESILTQSGDLSTALQTLKASADADAAAVITARDKSTEAATTTKGLADRAEKIESRIADYEKRLAQLESEAKEQLNTITNLLPGATSAGLASAFDKRRQTFLDPRKHWQWVFVGSLLLLVAIAFSGLWHVIWASSTLNYDDLIRVWLARIPIAGALIWLALYASHESSLAKRLEEDYGYKATIAASFEGFTKKMSEVASNAGPDTPIGKLCIDTLTTIGTPPGHIYEKHGPAPTPTSEFRDTLSSLFDKLKVLTDKGKAA